MYLSVTEDQSLNLYSDDYGEHYHCRGGAYTKAKEIFLKQTGFLDAPNPRESKRILEVGFGTGLNFFVTADAFLQAGMGLEYLSLEKNLLPAQVYLDLQYSRFLLNPAIVDEFAAFRDSIRPGQTCAEYEFSLSRKVVLRLRTGEAQEAVLPENYFDWVYLDPFSPDHNPELWTQVFLNLLHDVLVPGGGLSTYCVKGSVRRTLSDVGFVVSKRPGIPGKREITVAKKPCVLT